MESRKSWEERVEAEGLYKNAGEGDVWHQSLSRSRTRLDGAANNQSDQTFHFG
jgi:hypothetical protein